MTHIYQDLSFLNRKVTLVFDKPKKFTYFCLFKYFLITGIKTIIINLKLFNIFKSVKTDRQTGLFLINSINLCKVLPNLSSLRNQNATFYIFTFSEIHKNINTLFSCPYYFRSQTKRLIGESKINHYHLLM
jgi:hypothetical protein